MNNLTLKYGATSVTASLPEKTHVDILVPGDVRALEDIEDAVAHALDHPTQSKPFDDVFLPGDKVAVIINDVTRKTPTHKFLPLLIERLNRQGIPDADIQIIIGNGTHRLASEEEKTTLCGESIRKRISVVNHHCDATDLVEVGTTSRGTRVELNPLVTGRKVLLTGAIAHHALASFSGGRKGIVPGVAGRKTIFQNHSHGLHPSEHRLNPLTHPGACKENPVHLDMIECARLLEPEFLFNVIVNPHGEIAHMVAGHWLHAWETGRQWVVDHFAVPIIKRADIVLASAGGYPKDISFYQTTLSLANTALAVRPGGTIVMVAECREGLGPKDFYEWNDALLRGTLCEELRERFTISGHVFCLAHEVCTNAKVILVSSINPELLKPMGVHVLTSLDEALQISGIAKSKTTTVVIPDARTTVPVTCIP